MLMRFTEIHTNQHVLNHGFVVALLACGGQWSAYWRSYHLFQCSQRYYSCCFLVIDGHSSFRAQLVVVQKVRSTKLGASLPLWSGTFSGVTVTHRRSNKSLEKFACVFFDASPLFIPQAASNEPV